MSRGSSGPPFFGQPPWACCIIFLLAVVACIYSYDVLTPDGVVNPTNGTDTTTTPTAPVGNDFLFNVKLSFLWDAAVDEADKEDIILTVTDDIDQTEDFDFLVSDGNSGTEKVGTYDFVQDEVARLYLTSATGEYSFGEAYHVIVGNSGVTTFYFYTGQSVLAGVVEVAWQGA